MRKAWNVYYYLMCNEDYAAARLVAGVIQAGNYPLEEK